MIVTTSWDDGHHQNLKIAHLLDRYKIKGTFYIAGNYLNEESRKEIIKVAENYEVGAHTFSHVDLTKLNKEQCVDEIKKGKEVLEQVVNKEIKMFAYPFGFFNEEIKSCIKKNGFLGARTVENFKLDKPQDFFEMGTTLQVYPFPLRKRDATHLHGPKVVLQPFFRNFSKIIKCKLPVISFFSWNYLARNLFKYSLKKDGIFHLWGHAAELEKYDMWQELEDFLKFMSKREGIKYLTNGEVLEYY